MMLHTHTPIHTYLQRSLVEQVKRRSFVIMVSIPLVNLSYVTTTIMPFPLCVRVCLKYCSEVQRVANNVHKTPETSWGPHSHEHIHSDNAFRADITLTLFPLGPSPLACRPTISSSSSSLLPLFFLDLSLPHCKGPFGLFLLFISWWLEGIVMYQERKSITLHPPSFLNEPLGPSRVANMLV